MKKGKMQSGRGGEVGIDQDGGASSNNVKKIKIWKKKGKKGEGWTDR